MKFYVKAKKIGTKKVIVKVSFLLDRERPLCCFKAETVAVPVVNPFEVTTKFLSSMFEEVTKLYAEEEFVIMPIIESFSPWPLLIEDTSLSFVSYIQTYPYSFVILQLK